MKVPAVLKNKYLFYALAVLAALNVIGYASVKAYECLALFLLAGYGMHCYCNNKSLSILAALFVANFVFGCGRVKEGFQEAMKKPEELLKDAAEAASKAGEQLSSEGMDQQADACAAIAEQSNFTQEQCTQAMKRDNTPCDYDAPKCMKNNAHVAMLPDGTTPTTQQNCTGDVGKWQATCSQ